MFDRGRDSQMSNGIDVYVKKQSPQRQQKVKIQDTSQNGPKEKELQKEPVVITASSTEPPKKKDRSKKSAEKISLQPVV